MTRITQTLSLALIFGALFVPVARAQTQINAVTCAQTDVAAAVALATKGDTVVIPACPSGVSWTVPVQVTVGMTLQGQGIGKTVLIDNTPKGNSSCGGVQSMISFSVNSPDAFRLTGMTIQGSTPDTFVCNGGHVVLSGSSTAFRVDHVSFANQQTSAINTAGCLFGVVDHNTFSGNHKQGVIVRHSTCGGASFGDGDWAAATQLGSANFIFIETNTFTDPAAVGAGAFDVFGGGRVVFRYNNATFIVGHGTESSGRIRGMRAFEVYNNTFTAIQVAQFAAFYVRSGTGVIHDNQFNDSGSNNYTGYIDVITDRDADSFLPWGACDGTRAYDTNGGVSASGTYNGTSGTKDVMTDTTKNFAANQFVGPYAIRNMTQGWGSIIVSNTATTVTNKASVYGQNRSWNSGDQYQILSAYPCVDQVGRAAGVLLSGANPAPAGSVNEALEPVYQWNNTHNGSATVLIGSASTRILANRDYYDNTPMPGYTPFVYPHPLVMSTPSGNPPMTLLAVPH